MRTARLLLVLLPFTLVACTAEAPPAAKGAAPSDAAATTTGEDAAPVGTGTETADGVVYGEPIGSAPSVELTELVTNTDAYVGKRVRVVGLVTGVCAKRGCWFKIGAEEGPEEITFKVEDGVMVFPMSAQGKWAEAEGTVAKVEYSLEKTREYFARKAEESGAAFDPASVTEPLSLVRLAGIGAVIRDELPAATGE